MRIEHNAFSWPKPNPSVPLSNLAARSRFEARSYPSHNVKSWNAAAVCPIDK